MTLSRILFIYIYTHVFIPMPMPKTVRRAVSGKKWVQSEVCRTLFGRGIGMNIAAHLSRF